MLATVAYTINPYLRIGSFWHLYNMSMLVEVLHDRIHTHMYSIMSVFPNCLKAERSDWLRAWSWAALLAAAGWLWARAAEPRGKSAD